MLINATVKAKEIMARKNPKMRIIKINSQALKVQCAFTKEFISSSVKKEILRKLKFEIIQKCLNLN